MKKLYLEGEEDMERLTGCQQMELEQRMDFAARMRHFYLIAHIFKYQYSQLSKHLFR